jgi:hypothetical protein
VGRILNKNSGQFNFINMMFLFGLRRVDGEVEVFFAALSFEDNLAKIGVDAFETVVIVESRTSDEGGASEASSIIEAGVEI